MLELRIAALDDGVVAVVIVLAGMLVRQSAQ
jgi:hypothetical protein